MSLPDPVRWSYFDFLKSRTREVIVRLKKNVQASTTYPKQFKGSFVYEIVRDFYGEEASRRASAQFQIVVSERKFPSDMTEIIIKRALDGFLFVYEKKGEIIHSRQLSISSSGADKWTRFLAGIEEIETVAAAERMIKGKGLEVDGK